ncbi:hypothetical protein CcaverHIS002_0306420 [Cutaneotrichosporon cavernicola]|uniref:Uncharacterized protein n=1 Tax=Cutaneotrichosporon cavernicola TaxID=279322 RepID=A0AA48I3Q6_9TREE|nr:uncharacterized protein CcaverHIS019_0306360 [Cutaneotrichosporon cavernicola]BEI82774.1 hypothetical protein CcaverHIS002_0306420 [Cutaneotrichosporon cavernicola]BEI90566.1 hypothetical protein CcaverHIS019_0306360 [Cutaneotrichosporon cavernicola]BEI98341.1 hypothetical protein CcaverHIS631_0306400 [Cutaneotrichosporon cavernicola]BEJ06116.1 hypothetical protein CcaverHIS641_0306380 [Cutaneotrichosporon cavernicola]
MEEGEGGNQVDAAAPRRIAYNPFAENAEAGPSRPRFSQPTYSSIPAGDPVLDEDDEDDEPRPERKGAPEDLENAESDHPPSSDKPSPPRRRRPGPRRTRFWWGDVSNTPGFPWYNAELKLHQSITERHQRGVYSQEVNAIGWEATISSPLMTLWTPEEKGLFFAAIARHSRLRPDLIAHDIGTKIELEVSQYIEHIEASIKALPDNINQHAESQPWRDRLLGEGAYEAPPGFEEKEEHYAELVELLDRTAMESRQTGFPRVPGRRSRFMTPESRTAVEKWGETFTADKMDLTADLFRVAEDKARPKEARELPHLEGAEEMDQIEADNGMIDLIRAIPKKDRTAFQTKTLWMLVNRCKMRQKYRRKRLHAQGWTDDKIDAAGGPDKAFVSVKKGASGAKRKDHSANLENEDPAVTQLQDLGLDAYLENRGWELFNYDHMRQFIELHQSAHGVDPTTLTYNGASITTARGTSFAVLYFLYKHLWAYLRELLLRTYIIATAANPDTTEIEQWHVESALDAYGIPDPQQQLRDVLKEFERLNQIVRERETGVVQGVETQGQHEPVEGEPEEESENSADEEDQRPPDGQGDRVVRRRRPRVKIRDRAPSLREVALRPPALAEPPRDSDVWVAFHSETDDEDSELDERLDAVDTALDAVMACQLRGAATSDTVKRLDDRAWLDTRGKRGRAWRKARAIVPVPFNERANLARAIISYRELMARVTSDRRHRRKMAERSKLFPRHQAALAAARQRLNPPVPLHILGEEWMEDGVVHERPVTIIKRNPNPRPRKRKRKVGSSESDEEENIPRRESTTLRKRQKTREEPTRRSRSSGSDESEEWEASGDSSGGMSTDEDEGEPSRSPSPSVIVHDGASGDEDMDVDHQLVDSDDMEMADEEGVSMEVFAGDDALGSSDEADDDDDEDDDAHEAHDDDDDDEAHEAHDEDEKVHDDGKDDVANESDDNEASHTNSFRHSTDSLIGGDDALDSDSEGEKHEALSQGESDGEASSDKVVDGGDEYDTESDRGSDSVPNGRVSTSGSSEQTAMPNGSVQSHKSPNELATQPSASAPSHVQKGVHSDDEHSDDSDVDDSVLQESDHSEDEDYGTDRPINGWGGVPDTGTQSQGEGLLGGDDALDSDSDSD